MRVLPDDVGLLLAVHQLEPGVLEVLADVDVVRVHLDRPVGGEGGGLKVGRGDGLVLTARLKENTAGMHCPGHCHYQQSLFITPQ